MARLLNANFMMAPHCCCRFMCATWLIAVILLLCATRSRLSAVAAASVINDMNNMLRDDVDKHHYDDDNNGYVAANTVNAKLQKQQQQQQQQYSDDNNSLSNKQQIESNDNDANSNDNEDDVDDIKFMSSTMAQQMLRSVKNKQTNVHAAAESDETSAELLRFVNDNEDNDDNLNNNANDNDNLMINSESATTLAHAASDNNDNEATLSLNDQVRLLSKQLNALMLRRREDYALLEHNLRKSLRITTNTATIDMDIRNELEQLRHEVKSLRDGHLPAASKADYVNTSSNTKERLTIDWLQQSVTELRNQLVELQQIAANAVKDINRRTQSYEDFATIHNDFQQLKLELVALRERQQQTEVYVQELREETLQQEEDYKRLLHNMHAKQEEEHENAPEGGSDESATSNNEENHKNNVDVGHKHKLNVESAADHKRRHCRFQRQEIHELQLAQRTLKRQLNEFKYHRIGERVRNIEIEQHRIAEANFNLSRQIASLDKLHSSMLELLEDVEGLQNKMDKNIPELRHEISKLEFSNAQLNSEQNLVREEGKNVARSLQAMAVSVSTLQDERDGVKQMQTTVTQLQTNVDRLQSMMQDVQRALVHRRRTLADNKSQQQQHHQQQHNGSKQHHYSNNNNYNNNNDDAADADDMTKVNEFNNNKNNSNIMYTPMTQHAESLVAKLENVEQQYESIINKLPQDCSDASNNVDGLYLIAPAGQHRPLMAHCTNDGWTTVQRRYDGSVNFNRSWEDYAVGFGAPAGEYWMGNEQLHHLTRNNCTRLRVLMQDIYDNTWLAEYANFYISSRADGYRLHISGYAGNASDALDYQQGMQFSAIDVDRDISQTHCAANYEGGWWFSHCQHANLNGRYNLGLTWFDAARNEWIAVKSSQMLIKRQTAATSASTSSSSSPLCGGFDDDHDDDDSAAVVVVKAATTTTTIISSKPEIETETIATPLSATAATIASVVHAAVSV